MSYYCSFDQLPIELLHALFNYFHGHEIQFIFSDLSEYVDATLQSYSTYQLDFKSIRKSHFRRVCRHVRPEQVISLTLSDSNDTPAQSELFFSRFRIEQFTRLRSLTLFEIEFNSLESIFLNLHQLHRLRSFSFDADSIRHTYGVMNLNSENQLEQINSMLRNAYARLFPQLQFLHLNGGWVLESIPLPYLLYLKLERCPLDKLGTITRLAPKLRSLDVCISFDWMNYENISLPHRLTRLTLTIQYFPIQMNCIEYLLSNCSYLKHLQLHVRGSNDLTDGQRWQTLTNSLLTFNFKFNVYLALIEQTLDSFRTSFWLEEKQWFVAYEDECLFSVPYFAPNQVCTSYQPPIHSTAPDNTIFYRNITKLNVTATQTLCTRFTHINTLEIEHPISRTKLSRFLDLRYVRHLSILSLDDLLQFTSFGRHIPHQCQLSVRNKITGKEIERMKNNSYEQIRILKVGISHDDQDHIIKELLRLFPRTECFICQSDIQSIAVMVRFINGFKHLLNASFISFGPLNNDNEMFRYDPDLMVLKTNRLTYGITKCRIYHLPNNTARFGVYWWIEE